MTLRERLKNLIRQALAPEEAFRERFAAFRDFLGHDDACLAAVTALEELALGEDVADWERVVRLVRRAVRSCMKAAGALARIDPEAGGELGRAVEALGERLEELMRVPVPDATPPYVVPLGEAAGRPKVYGGKAAALGALAGAGFPVPPGVAVSVGAWHFFKERNALDSKLAGLLGEVILSRPADLERLCGRMVALVAAGEFPRPLRTEIERAAAGLAESDFSPGGLLAVRSSAVAEDGELSFAGQYESRLNVPPAKAASAYREVLSSKYRAKAVTYRAAHGLADAETPMAALILPMVPAAVSGVLYSLDPGYDRDGARALGVYAVAGLADALVAGRLSSSRYYLSREGDAALLASEIEPGGARLGSEVLGRLAELGLALEAFFHEPQDVEWALTASGELFVLQSRPVAAPPPEAAPETPAEAPNAEVLLEGGLRVSGGAAAGRIFHAQAVVDPESVPRGAVLCVPALPPSLSKVAARVGAVVAETGSRAGHFASIAREYGLPVLVGAKDACRLLAEGQSATVDADAGTVYAGRLDGLLAHRRQSGSPEETPTGRRLAALAPLVCRLNLTDPEAPDFQPAGVQSLHDAARFAHETIASAMFALGEGGALGAVRAKRFAGLAALPIRLLDLGGGLVAQAAGKREVAASEVASEPFLALWRGLSGEKTSWDQGLVHMDWEAFDRISGGLFAGVPAHLSSLALVGGDYVHFLFRMGYHFAVTDAYCGPRAKNNRAAFRFKGGGGGDAGRRARLRFVREVLRRLGFAARLSGDMLEAVFERRDREETLARLEILGGLMARTRLMDMALDEDSDPAALAEAFLEGRRGAGV